MPTNQIEAQIKERIQAFVQELDLLIRRGTLDSLRAVLEGGKPARRGRAGRRAGRGRGVNTEAILAHVRANPGQTVTQIASALGSKPKALVKVVKGMLAEKQLRKAGQRRGTRYYPAGARVAAARSSRRKRGRKAGGVARSARKAKRRTKPKRKARATTRREKRAPSRSSKKAIVIPARRRGIPASKQAKRGKRPARKAKVVSDQARVDLLASL